MSAVAALHSAPRACPGGALDRARDRVSEAPTPSLAPSPVITDAMRSAAAAAAARDWLETQARVVEYWRDLLAEAGGTDELIEALDVHAAFLNGMVARG